MSITSTLDKSIHKQPRRQVCFGTYSEGRIIDLPTDEDIENTSYSKADNRQFCQQLQTNVLMMAQLFATTTSIPR
jgi:hypothetical protein